MRHMHKMVGLMIVLWGTAIGNAETLFMDNFDSGLSNWASFGTPLPSTFYDTSFEDNWGYTTNGDGWYQSGSYTYQKFDLNHPFVVEFRLKQPAGYTWDLISVNVGRYSDGYSENDHPAYFGIQVFGVNPDGVQDLTNDIRYRCYNGSNYSYFTEDQANDHQFHTYKMYYDPNLHSVTFYRDGYEICTLPIATPPLDSLPLMIEGRSYSENNYLDYIKVGSNPTDAEESLSFENPIPDIIVLTPVAHSTLQLRVVDGKESKISFVLYNIHGRQVCSYRNVPVLDGYIEISTQNLPSGVYFLQPLNLPHHPIKFLHLR